MSKEYNIPFVKSLASQFELDQQSMLKNWLCLYGEKEVFQKRQQEGYTHIRLGSGLWFHFDLNNEGYYRFLKSARIQTFTDHNGINYLPAEEIRIVAITAFYHPDGRIATFENIKYRAHNWSIPGSRIESIFSITSDFDQFTDDFGVELIPEINLSEINDFWNKIENN